MRKILLYLPVLISAVVAGVILKTCVTISVEDDRMPGIAHKEKFESPDLALFPKRLHVEGNRIASGDNPNVKLAGIMAVDFFVMHTRNRSNEENIAKTIEAAKSMHANVIRVAVHPRFWAKDPDYLWRFLDPAVELAGKNGMYVDICWQCIGNIDDGYGSEMPEQGKSKETTYEFWNLLAGYFDGAPNVLFEIFNEPMNISARAWEKNARGIVELIRARNRDAILIVGSPEYSSNLRWIGESAIEGKNIAYSAHIYPNHREDAWDYLFGDVSEKVPVLMTEWGFMVEKRDSGNKDQWILYGNEESYGYPLIRYMDDHGMGWIACFYDYDWEPPMLDSSTMRLNRYGEFVKEQLKRYSE